MYIFMSKFCLIVNFVIETGEFKNNFHYWLFLFGNVLHLETHFYDNVAHSHMLYHNLDVKSWSQTLLNWIQETLKVLEHCNHSSEV